VQPIIEQAVKRIPSEPYPELRAVLEKFVAGVQNALKGNFAGAYLVGSLAIGDFDLDSDIDFLIVTGEELSDADVPLLQALHLEIYNLGCYPARHLEGSFISRHSLARTDLVGLQPFWFVDNGSTLLERSVHDNQWHVRWVLRERGITLTGPDAKTLVEPVSPVALRAEMQGSIERLKTLFLAEIDKPLGWFNSRLGQSFAVLTCCRVLNTLQSGAVKSKLAAVQWAEQTLDAKWHKLIRQAWTERKGVRFGVKVRQLADVTLLQETARFVAYSQRELSQQR
jgi:predicted nucleotidyltransferase